MKNLVMVWAALEDELSSARLARGLMMAAPGQMIVQPISFDELELTEAQRCGEEADEPEPAYGESICFLITDGPIQSGYDGKEKEYTVDASRVFMSIKAENPLMCFGYDLEEYWFTVVNPRTGEIVQHSEPIPNSVNARAMATYLIGVHHSLLGIVNPLPDPSGMPVVVFGSFHGGAGVTTVALATAYMLKHIYGERVLYLSLTATDGAAQYLPNCNSSLAGHFFLSLERLVENPETARDRFPLDSYFFEGELCDYLSIGTMGKYQDQIREETIQCLLSMVKKCGRYDYVFFDIGNQIQGISHSLFLDSDLSVLVQNQKRMGLLPEKWFLRDWHEYIREFPWTNPGMQVVNYAQGPEESSLMVSEAPSNFISMGGKIRIQVKGNYGLEIAEIAKRIRERVRERGSSPNGFGTRWDLSGEIETAGSWVSSGGSGGGTEESD